MVLFRVAAFWLLLQSGIQLGMTQVVDTFPTLSSRYTHVFSTGTSTTSATTTTTTHVTSTTTATTTTTAPEFAAPTISGNTDLTEGGTTTLTCSSDAQGADVLYQFFSHFFQQFVIDFPPSTSNTLVVGPVTTLDDDEISYYCKVIVGDVSSDASNDVTLNVRPRIAVDFGPPNLTITPNPVGDGSDFNLLCDALGAPAIQFTFLADDDVIAEQEDGLLTRTADTESDVSYTCYYSVDGSPFGQPPPPLIQSFPSDSVKPIVTPRTTTQLLPLETTTARPSTPAALPCGSVTYNPQRELCCQTIVRPKQPHDDCCGKRSYDTTRRVCCDGKVRKNIPNASCCRRKVYDNETQVCCRGEIRTALPNPKCCDDEVYDETAQICCAGKVRTRVPDAECCGNKVYSTTSQVCCEGGVNAAAENPRCCGKNAYSFDTQICCEGKVRHRTGPNAACCDKDAYSEDAQICCEGKIRRKVQNAECCRTRVYNSQTHACCDGLVRRNSHC